MLIANDINFYKYTGRPKEGSKKWLQIPLPVVHCLRRAMSRLSSFFVLIFFFQIQY